MSSAHARSGAIFGGRFLFDSLRYKDPLEIRYTVVKKSASGQPPYRICANPNCGTFHPPIGEKIEQHCTQCGSPLQPSDLLFLLQEARQPIFGAAVRLPTDPVGWLIPTCAPHWPISPKQWAARRAPAW